MLKTCNVCKEMKSISQFSTDQAKMDKLCGMCQACNQKRCNKWYSENKLRQKNNRLKQSYGVTLEEYNRILGAQAGVCAICKLPPSGAYKSAMSLNIDHCHTTGKIRGLLCNKCNSGIGFFQESVELTAKATEYLGKGDSDSYQQTI